MYLQETLVTPHSIERGFLILSSVNIGKDCKVGALSVLMPDISLDNGVTLEPMSMVPLGSALAPMTAWEGTPVRPRKVQAEKAAMASRGVARAHLSGISEIAPLEEGAKDAATAVQGRLSPQQWSGLCNASVCLFCSLATLIAFMPMGIGFVYFLVNWRVRVGCIL